VIRALTPFELDTRRAGMVWRPSRSSGAAVVLCVEVRVASAGLAAGQASSRRLGATLIGRARVAAGLRPADAADRGRRVCRRSLVSRGRLGRLPRAQLRYGHSSVSLGRRRLARAPQTWLWLGCHRQRAWKRRAILAGLRRGLTG
jgi:hypothetical protein